MILKFDEFVSINEGVESVVKFSELCDFLSRFGWEVKHKSSGDGITISKGRHIVGGHLKHGNSKDENRKVDINTIDKVREYIIQDFIDGDDLSFEAIKEIPWERWNLKDPLKKELKNIDPETGKEYEVEPELNMGHILNKAKVDKALRKATEDYKDAVLWKIDDNDENSAYIMSMVNKFGGLEYNTCRSMEDRRPIYTKWYGKSLYKKIGKYYYFGKDDFRINKTKFYRILSNGRMDRNENVELRESKNFDMSENETIFAV